MPFNVSVFVPMVRAPCVRSRMPATVRLAPKTIPFGLFMARLFNPLPTAGKVVLAPEPPKIILEEAPPVHMPAPANKPLKVMVLAPIEKPVPPLVNVPATVIDPPGTFVTAPVRDRFP